METLTVKKNGKYYLLNNLTTQNVHELQDPINLSLHFNNCLQSGTNISILPTTDENSVSMQTPSTSSSVPAAIGGKKCGFDFLCGTFDKRNYIYGIRCGGGEWHYFEDHDTVSAQHVSLPAIFHISISRMTSVGTKRLLLDESQARQYFKNGKFIFKNKELKKRLAIVDDQLGEKASSDKGKNTKQLIFISGQTNPLLFLNDFEKCSNVKSSTDKMHELLHFVDEVHKGEFTDLYFNADWDSVKSKFLSLYTLPYVQNKKKELNVDFDESQTLRSFFELKLTNLSKFTTLPFYNQIEVIMNELPIEISSQFILQRKMTCNKTEILDFCDTIQNYMYYHQKSKVQQPSGSKRNRMEMEIFNFTPEERSPIPSGKRGRRGAIGRGNNSKIEKRDDPMNTITEDGESSESSSSFSFLREVDNSSRSTWDETND